MERIRKTFFDPLATSKARIRELLQNLPVGSAHPYSPEQIILCRTENGVVELDISSYPEEFFFNAVDLGEMGEVLLRRMAGFQHHLGVFDDFQILQAPASTFRIPLVPDQITILALSERKPTYYDLCFGNASGDTCCYSATHTFPGMKHSGDISNGQEFLAHVKFTKDPAAESDLCCFISGYQGTRITKFLGTYPALLVADHILYIVPVPLDSATIGDATICCPLVIKRDEDSLICSILPTATTDREIYCHGSELQTRCLPEAIERAEFNMTATQPAIPTNTESQNEEDVIVASDVFSMIMGKENAVITTHSATLPSFIRKESVQVLRFGTGLEFDLGKKDGRLDRRVKHKSKKSAVVLPCIFGSQLQGPLLLATGTAPSDVPFGSESALLNYYKQLKNVVVIVDEKMTDNARNLAGQYRLNALFLMQLTPQDVPMKKDDVLSLLNTTNINAVTALAGPQSLILVQVFDKFYFYRGLGNREIFNTSKMPFGADVTSLLESVDMQSILDPRIQRVVELTQSNRILLPSLGRFVEPEDLPELFEELPFDGIFNLEEDICAAVPQLQVLMNQKDLQVLSKALINSLSTKINSSTAPLKDNYVKFIAQEYNIDDPESAKKKARLLGELRSVGKDMQRVVEPVISNLANMMSAQTTSRRTHDLKRLVRQGQIAGNVEAAKAMTFENLAQYLETYAEEMGVMLLNIETIPYQQLLSNLKHTAIDASASCELDSRILHLEGFDAGVIIEQSQCEHLGPLQHQAGPSQPTLAVPYLSPGRGDGSMLAWVCWDEFVNLTNPYSVRWMEKCNEAHIAALRIIMRATLSQAVTSREYNMQPGDQETGSLMSALLMAGMSKLAAMRTTPPVEKQQAEDTVIKLMRGLFGNLLTIAGSGVRPLSMVWQLFGQEAQFEIPTTEMGWMWYHTVVDLYPYTGWPRAKFYDNLERFLDKALVRVATVNEDISDKKSNRMAEMIKFCKLRNIELGHSRTIITIMMRMLTTDGIDVSAVASRLRKQLPEKLERNSMSYTKLIGYLEHLANWGPRRAVDDVAAANVYTRRSATFAALKSGVSNACINKDWELMKHFCQELIDEHARITALWSIEPKSLIMQNMKPYKDLLHAEFDNVNQATSAKNDGLTRQVLGDAEKKRVPWQVGKEGQFGDKIEPLDESLVHEILTGEDSDWIMANDSDSEIEIEPMALVETKTEKGILEFKKVLRPDFVTTMQKDLSGEDVCRVMKIPASTMQVFIKALNPEFVWEDLASNFKTVILDLVRNRSCRLESRPIRKLLELDCERRMLMDGAQ
ncbi:hypothetical protein K461DRAFT_292308 [Myriangium duriaei CBS 260.36]|uniref:Uncharacterized protein n=1 Tax=Myriangium duriaei CBS 260.36 TaxID=1168546 RepID=A0A9P4J7D4_9PEZI|nr:hypothetical protein K461DRAFT_292308 [Myriangium duriaei CBS 260.36]